VDAKSLGEIKFDAVDGALDAAHHQKVLIVQPVEVQTQWRRLELDLAGQLVVLQHLHLVGPSQADGDQVVLRAVREGGGEAVGVGVVRLVDVQRLNQIAAPEVVQLGDVVVLVVAGQQHAVLQVQAVRGHRRPADLPHRPRADPRVPDLDGRVPPAAEEEGRVLGQALDAEDAVGVVVEGELLGSSRLEELLRAAVTCAIFMVVLSKSSTVFWSVPKMAHSSLAW
jgi:hypothetical protein